MLYFWIVESRQSRILNDSKWDKMMAALIDDAEDYATKERGE